MKRSRFTEEQIIAVLREQAAGFSTAEVCRKHAISTATFYAWKAKFGGMEASEAKRRKQLENEKAKLKRLLVDAMLDNAALKDLMTRNPNARRQAGALIPERSAISLAGADLNVLSKLGKPGSEWGLETRGIYCA
jgi:putative transposase